MRKKKLLIFDADGTLRRPKKAKIYPLELGDWYLLENVEKFFRENKGKYFYGIASNQSGVHKGELTYNTALELLYELGDKLGISRKGIMFCPDSSRSFSVCRKPQPYMLNEICKVYGVIKEDALYIGDMDTDRECAKNAGIDYMDANEFFDRK